MYSSLKNRISVAFPKTPDGEPYGAVFDPCCGYGTALIGACAHPEIKYFFANDPNEELLPRYSKIVQTLKPSMTLVVSKEKIEEMTEEELTRDGKKVSLITCSPPYNLEVYCKDTQDYRTEAARNKLYHGLLNTSRILLEGHFMLVFLGIVGPEKKPLLNLPKLFSALIPQHDDLEHIKTVPLLSVTRGNGLTQEKRIFGNHPQKMFVWQNLTDWDYLLLRNRKEFNPHHLF